MIELSEDRIPLEGIEASIEDLVELYGGSIRARRPDSMDLTLRSTDCTISWAGDAVTIRTERDTDAAKPQRVVLLIAGVIGSLLFMLWPFFPGERAFGTLAWFGGAVAIAVYLMTLRKSGGGVASDFLQRLARRQRDNGPA